METRKIYKTGGSTFVVSLPKKWVVSSGIKEGDSVKVTPQEGSVIIEPGMVEKGPSEIEIDASEIASAEALERLIIAYYLVGYDTIKIRFDKKDVLDYKEGVRHALALLIGVEIIEDIGDMMTLEILLDQKRMPTPQVLKRMFMIEKSMLVDLIRSLKEQNTELARDVMGREREIDRLYFLVVRQLKSAVRYHQVAEKLDIDYQRDTLGYRIAVKSFERIADHLENLASSFIQLQDAARGKDLTDFADFAEGVLKTYEKATTAFFKRDSKVVDEVFMGTTKVEKTHLQMTNQLFMEKGDVQESLLKWTMLDSLSRIAGYSTDIAEIAVNMSVQVP
jgi:phosphate uptake regulator